MEEILVKAEIRNGRGKSIAKNTRKQGGIPCVLYGRGLESLGITISSKEWEKLRKRVKKNTILKMELLNNGSVEERPVMVKDMQKGILKDDILHIDFLQVSMERKIEVEIPIRLTGDAIGLKKNGIVELHLRSIMVECLPSMIPEKIDLDVTNLDIGDSIHANEIVIPGVKVLENLSVAIVTVIPPSVEEKAVTAEAPEAEKKEA